MLPDVTVVIPTKNRRAHFRRALGTALGQRRVTVEVIAVDGGSEDNTAEDARQLAHLGVRVIRHDQSPGLSAARNAGIAEARAPWIAFLDDDDMWAPDKLATQLERVEQARPDGSRPEWVCCSCVLVDERDRIIGWASAGPEDIDAPRLLVNGIVPGGGSGVMVRTDALRDVGPFDESLKLYEDWDMWIRFALRGGAPSVDRPLVAYRVWRSMSSAAVDLEGAWRGITDRYVEDANRLGVRTDPAAYYRYRAFRSLHSGRHHEAAEAYRRLAELNSSRKSSALAVAAHRAGSPLLSVLSWRDRRRVPQAIRNEATGWLDDVERNGHRWVGELPGLV